MCSRTMLQSRAVRGKTLHLSANKLQCHYLCNELHCCWCTGCINLSTFCIPHIQKLTFLCCPTVDQVLQQKQRIKMVLYGGCYEVMAVSCVTIWERSIEVLLICKPFRFYSLYSFYLFFFLELLAFLKNWLQFCSQFRWERMLQIAFQQQLTWTQLSSHLLLRFFCRH